MKRMNIQTIGGQYTLQLIQKNKLLPLITIIGSLLIVVGTLMPWITILGGLESYAGITGLNGKILLAAGSLSLIGGGALWIKQSSMMMRWIVGLYGFGLLGFCSWLLLGLWKTYQITSQDGMVVGGLGPGLFITTLGATFLFFALFL